MKLISLLLFCPILIITIAKAQVAINIHSETIPIILERVSTPLKDIPVKPVVKSGKHGVRDNPSLEPEHRMPEVNPHALPMGADPALQKVYSNSSFKLDSAGGEITVLSSWAGLDADIDPSDNCIAVGPDHVIQMTNNTVSTLIRIWDKSGNMIVPNILAEDISGINDFGDPNIIYDEQADRFVFLTLYGFQSKLVVCISATGDPTGSWYAYSFSTVGGFPDYPKLAVWGDTYYITTNSNSPSLFALKRSALMDGSPVGFIQKFSLSALPNVGFQAPSPVNVIGSTPPPVGEDALVMRVADDAWGGNLDSDQIQIFKVHIDWLDSSNNLLSGPLVLKTIPYNSTVCSDWDSWNCIPQPNTTQKLDPLGNIVMDKSQYRAFSDHESIVCTNVVDDGNNVAGVRWYELRKQTGTDWYIYQQGTYSPPDGQYRWMSSITINDKGSIALGYNISGSVEFPGIRVTGRTECDDYGIMSSAESIIQNGVASQASDNRYGDYNGTVTDPSDGSFWITGQYNPTSNWGTRVGHFTIDPCVAVTAPSVSFIANTLKLTPVPAANYLEIRMYSNTEETDAALHFISMSGKILMQQSFPIHTGDNTTTLDVSSLTEGFYVVELKSKQGSVFQKLVIER